MKSTLVCTELPGRLVSPLNGDYSRREGSIVTCEVASNAVIIAMVSVAKEVTEQPGRRTSD